MRFSGFSKMNYLLVSFFPLGVTVGCLSWLLWITLWRYPRAALVSSTGNMKRTVVREMASESYSSPDIALEYFIKNIEQPYLLLVLVHSTADASLTRTVIRDTWLADNHKQRFVAKFVIGTAGQRAEVLSGLSAENETHGDLVLLPRVADSTDQVYSSSEKLMYSLMWARDNVDYMYIFKCTDRTFARLDVMMEELEERDDSTDLVWGYFAGNVEADREFEKKWFLCTTYVPYPQGGGYVISRDVATIVTTLAATNLEYYTHDDISLGVWLSPFDNIERRHDVRFNTGYVSRGCSNTHIVSHDETMETLYDKFQTLNETGNVCEEEVTLIPPYVYNWEGPLSSCCEAANETATDKVVETDHSMIQPAAMGVKPFPLKPREWLKDKLQTAQKMRSVGNENLLTQGLLKAKSKTIFPKKRKAKGRKQQQRSIPPWLNHHH